MSQTRWAGPTVLILEGLRSLGLARQITDPLDMAIAIRPVLGEQIGSLSRAWVRDYRDRYPEADRWASGPGHVCHSTETQERVFRMTEQLVPCGIKRSDVFTALSAADRSVALAGEPNAAAEAGLGAITELVRLDGQSILICADQYQRNLRPFGFDPIPFDGHDPAAYAWVMFELSARSDPEAGALDQRSACNPSEAPTAIGLARL